MIWNVNLHEHVFSLSLDHYLCQQQDIFKRCAELVDKTEAS